MKVTVKYAEINGNRAEGQKYAVKSKNPKSMTTKSLKKINACISWYPLVNKRIRKKMQVT